MGRDPTRQRFRTSRVRGTRWTCGNARRTCERGCGRRNARGRHHPTVGRACTSARRDRRSAATRSREAQTKERAQTIGKEEKRVDCMVACAPTRGSVPARSTTMLANESNSREMSNKPRRKWCKKRIHALALASAHAKTNVEFACSVQTCDMMFDSNIESKVVSCLSKCRLMDVWMRFPLNG